MTAVAAVSRLSRWSRVPAWEVDQDAAMLAAKQAGVCIRPVVRVVTDRVTGDQAVVPIPCGSTREAVCEPCAVKARRLRVHQCREGWHRTDEPPTPDPTDDQDELGAAQVNELDDDRKQDEGGPEGEGSGRQVRSTRRLSGFPDLPTIPMDQRTTGRGYTDLKTGAVYRPSMFVTLTLPSYGKVIPGTGVPVDPARYDYRRAALDALLWPRLLDRFWQNLRRCAGYKVQYFSAIEAQRRLAPHLHAAVRGSMPRATIKAVVRATYHAAWWPALEQHETNGGGVPVWEATTRRYVNPRTGDPLPQWNEATADLEEPAHVVTFGAQVDVKGLLGGSPDSDRAVRYLCKYLTKNVSDTYSSHHPHPDSNGRDHELQSSAVAAAYERHIDRLHQEVRWLPCSPGCANWLRYGVTPKDPGPGMIPGRCPSPAHDRENLGLGGRRVLVSRQWSGKTLTEHRADRRAVVAQVLDTAGIDTEDLDRFAADQLLPDGTARFYWDAPDSREVDYITVIAASLRNANRWRQQYQDAKDAAGERGSPPGDSHSATQPAV